MSAAGAPDPSAAYWTRLLSDPAFRAMPSEQRAELLKRQVQEARAAQTGGNDLALGQTIGAVPKTRLPPVPQGSSVPSEEGGDNHPLDTALTDPNANHMQELERYVYGE